MSPQVSIPLSATPSQSVSIQLGSQACRVEVYQKRTGLFVDLYVGNRAILTGMLARDRTWMVRDAYLGFSGDLAFIDTQGSSDPDYTGLGGRFVLVWGS